MDLSHLGHQPMINVERQIYVVYNGEIYNFKELKIELQAKGYAFFSTCDTEVVVTAVMLIGKEPFYGSAAACGIMGISGEISEHSLGNGSFQVGLMDAISNIDFEMFSERLNMEEIKWTDR